MARVEWVYRKWFGDLECRITLVNNMREWVGASCIPVDMDGTHPYDENPNNDAEFYGTMARKVMCEADEEVWSRKGKYHGSKKGAIVGSILT